MLKNSISLKKSLLGLIFIAAGLLLFSCASTKAEAKTDKTETAETKKKTFTIKEDPYESPYVINEVADDDFENMEALQFVRVMGNGINLGNTFEAAGSGFLGFNAKPQSYEQAWGQPVTTKDMFAAYKAAGFDSVRIPVAWTSTMDWRNGDFTINEDFLERIKTVVDWALDEDLIVMINDHWDYQWWGLFGSNKELAYKIFDAIWDQVGEYFKDYSYKLVFEAGNEEWGSRFNDDVDGVKGNLGETKQYELCHELSQYFVDKIRAQGSNNAKRFLLIPGFNTDFTKTIDSRFIMPEDPTNSVKKLLLSVHYYSPSLYCILGEPASWGTPMKSWGAPFDILEQNRNFRLMTKYSELGYGIVIGEYGVSNIKNEDGIWVRKEGDTVWMSNVLYNCDRYNFAPFLWDCNGYFKKSGKIGFKDADVAEIYLKKE